MYRGGQLRDILEDSEVGVTTIEQFRHLGPFTHPLSSNPSVDHGLLSCFLTLHFFLSDKQKLPRSNPLFGFLAHVRAADACTELIELAFEKNKLLIGKGIGERLRKTNQEEGRCRPDKITHDEPTRVAINYFK